jgi:hypothetical protein
MLRRLLELEKAIKPTLALIEVSEKEKQRVRLSTDIRHMETIGPCCFASANKESKFASSCLLEGVIYT